MIASLICANGWDYGMNDRSEGCARTGYLIPVRDALWTPARMDVLFPRRRRRRRRRRRHSENSD